MDRAISLEARRVELAFEPPFQLGPVRVDPAAHEIAWRGGVQRLQPQALKVLVALHDKLGSVVTRDELVTRCWDGRFVGDDVINRCVSILRRTGPKSGGIEIQTVPRGGYRLVERDVDESAKLPPRRRWTGAAIASFAACAVVALGVYLDRAPATASGAVVGIEPLKASSQDQAAQALSDGMSSAISNDLVGSETPVAIVDGVPPSGAALLVRGTAITSNGSTRTSLELVSAPTGQIVWSGNYEGPSGHIDDLREQLSLQIAKELHCAYALGAKPYFDSDVQFAKLILAHCDTGGSDIYEGARLDPLIIQRAPRFASAWSSYAIDTALKAYDSPPLIQASLNRQALAFANHALALDPHQGMAYTAIGVATQESAPWLTNERRAQHAISVDPTNFAVHDWQAGMLGEIGRLQDSLKEALRSYDLDHFLPVALDQVIRVQIETGDLDTAEENLTLGRRDWPGNWWWDNDALLLARAGRHPEQALPILADNRLRLSPATVRMDKAFLQWRMQPSAQTKEAARTAIEAAATTDGATGDQVRLLAELGEIDAAYRLGSRLPKKHGAPWFGPELKTFRADPRFMPLAARSGLAVEWLSSGLWPDYCVTEAPRGKCRQAALAALKAGSGS